MSTHKANDRKGFIAFLIEDFLMLFLLIINLIFISFDWLFQSQLFRDAVFFVSADFHNFYLNHIHPDFVVYDLIFVSIFLTEFFIRWIVAIYRKEFQHWYYFPFVYWYDLLGCIPIGAFRFLRLLRVVSIAVRLHKNGWIDLTRLPIFSIFIHYFNVFVQIVTDRVSLRILGNIRAELKDGTPVIDRIIQDVLIPRQQIMIDWFSERLRIAAAKGYELHEQDIRQYVQQSINDAVHKNKELKNLENIPFMGSLVVRQIEGAISDIVFNVTNGLIKDLASDKNKVFVEDISQLILTETDDSTAEMQRLNVQFAEVLSESLGIIMKRIQNEDLNPKDIQHLEQELEAKVRAELNL